MKKSRLSFLVVILMVTLCSLCILSCDDLIEPDIENDSVFLIAPGDSIVADSTRNVNFSWEFVDGADFYQFQLVTGDFASPNEILIDSIVESTRLSLPVDPGDYSWGVSGQNSAFATVFASRPLHVETQEQEEDSSSVDLSDIQVDIISPSDTFRTINDTVSVTFFWEKVDGATSYEFILFESSLSPMSTPVDSTLSENNIVLPLSSGQFTWRIKAVNDDSESTSFERTLVIEKIPDPSISDISALEVNAISPKDSTVFNKQEIIFLWDELEGATSYKVRISSPTIDSPAILDVQSFELDSTIIRTTLPPGAFEWEVIGVNEVYETIPVINEFAIDTTTVN